eukprot:5689266-Amphidinium_carterae.1
MAHQLMCWRTTVCVLVASDLTWLRHTDSRVHWHALLPAAVPQVSPQHEPATVHRLGVHTGWVGVSGRH